MKIKRLTAGLAVAAMAAGFTLASPMLSAQAQTLPVPTGAWADTYAAGWGVQSTPDIAGDPIAPAPDLIDVKALLLNSPSNSATSASPMTTYPDGVQQANVDWALNDTTNLSWGVTKAQIYSDSPAVSGSQSVPNRGGLGTVTFSPTSTTLTYTPEPGLGVKAPATVYIYFEITGTPTATNTWFISGTTDANMVGITGWLQVVVGKPALTACQAGPGVILTADLQAFGKFDDPASAKVDAITPNIKGITYKSTASIIPTVTDSKSWFVYSYNMSSSNDPSLQSNAALAESYLAGTPSKSTSLLFSAPKNWSGSITYQYWIAKVDNAGAWIQNSQQPGCFIVTVHPTLTAPDPITSDPGAKVTVPLLGKGTLPIIGSAPFQNANCVFASNNKIKDSAVGTINNFGMLKNPVFTPNADFVGSVDLLCTVDDAFGTTSNAVTVTIQVGTPAPVVPAAPTTPACDNCSNGKLVSTGGSLATPMSSGLAAVVLLVAAGAGILVVRRRTALAG